MLRECRCLGAAVAATLALAPGAGFAQTPRHAPEVPAKITTPNTVRTRVGTLRFKDGAADPETVRLAYDQIDFSCGIEAFLRGMSATSVLAICNGLEQAGVKANSGIGITERLMDAHSLFLTPNTTTVYVLQCLNLMDGPMVVRVPPRAPAVSISSCPRASRVCCPPRATTWSGRAPIGW